MKKPATGAAAVSKCSHHRYENGRPKNCTRNASTSEGGKLWCFQHSPSAQKARADARSERWDKESRRFAEIYALRSAAPALLDACKAVLDSDVPLPLAVREQVAAAVRAARVNP